MDWRDRITTAPLVMGGKPCIRGTRVTVGVVLSLLAEGYSADEILGDYSYVQRQDIAAALAFAAWRARETEAPIEGGVHLWVS